MESGSSCVLRPASHALFYIIPFLLLIASTAHARPPKRFHEGPYLQILVGAMDTSYDTASRTGQKVGRDTQATYGLIFGWNVTDPAAIEMVGRYTNAPTFGDREHIVRLNVNFRWNFIFDKLTGYRSLRLLPFLLAGPMAQVTVLPGDPGGGQNTVTQWGGGISAGGGLSVLFKEYIYMSAMAQSDIVRRLGITQNLGGVNTTTYAGGWHVGWSAMTGLGVHF